MLDPFIPSIKEMLLRMRVLLKNKSGLDVSALSARCYNYKTFSSTSRGGGSDGGRAVMSFGDGSHGALGLGSSSILGVGDDAYEPMQIPGLPQHITSIGAGHYHSLAVTAGGEVWAWGRDNEAQLGRGSSHLPRDSWNEPKMVQGLNQVRVKEVCASGVVSAAIGEDGSLWVWGKSKRGQLGLGNGVIEASLPSRVEALAGEEIVKVSLGWGHAIAQTKDGKVFGWGYSADGRLGHIGIAIETSKAHQFLSEATSRPTGKPSSSSLDVAEKLVLEQMEKENDMPIIWEPCLLQELRDVPVSDVACGLDHSLILRSDGLLLSGGSNTYGQLGRDTVDLGLLPVEMNFQPSSISSGLGHSLALCQMKSPEAAGEINGIVTWGWNRNYQLGRQGQDNIPSLVEGLEGETPVSVSGGRVHSVALTSKGEVWVWGCGRSGRLGLGSSADESEPALLEYLQDFEVLQVVSGFDHNLVLVNT